jgi:hypothetical protein
MTPSATGTLAATPLAHALIYSRNRRLTGRLELVSTDERQATISLWRGSITAVETVPVGLCPGAFFGAIAYELGFIDSTVLDETLLEIAKTKRLHGEVLLERKAMTPAQRDEVLVEQIHRKIHHLFSLPETTKYAFYDARTPPIEPPVAVDCVGPVWRGIRDYPPLKFVAETTRRVGNHALRATTGGSARLPPLETALFQALAERPMTVEEMKASTELPPARVELLVYLLVIAKCVEAVSGVRTHPSTGALPVSMPSGPIPTVTSSSGEIRHASREMPGPRYISSGSMHAVTPQSGPVAVVRPATGSSGELPGAGPGSQPRLPAAPSSSSRLPAAPDSSPRIPAVPGSNPRIPSQRGPRPAPTPIVMKTPLELGVEGVKARALMVEHESYFEVLGLPEGGSSEAARAAYMRLSKLWHPDRLPPQLASVKAEATKIFTHMTKAQRTLCDPDARRTYLAERNPNSTRPRDQIMRDVRQALDRRDFETVIDLCATLLDRDPEDAETLAIQTWAELRGGEATEEELRAALPKMDKAVNMDRTSDEAFYHRGLVHKRLNNVPAAFRDFARALQLNPSHIAAEREVRLFAMRVKKGSGEHKLIAPLLERLGKK